ncbi:SGNH/GDSL hydrolase family protein [Moraxella oblonga]|uniref:SGNH/GDSL hydrolase family protein n=1 Tax=Moraxella oblonga TaxID=200413 RepID=UPI00083569F8|nr:SGNH/GDSL hydrolase family protein [Moraxella oblonga]
MAIELFGRRRDYLLALIYYAQAKRVAKTVLRLPEPDGVRAGRFGDDGRGISLAIFGDSAAAGVGVDSQDDAPFGQIGWGLAEQGFGINVELHATSGHTSFDLLYRLYVMGACRFDVAIISIGVNDVVKASSNKAWTDNLHAIITLLKRKFGVSHILFLSLPPMHLAPSLPTPLNGLIGRRAMALDAMLAQICQAHQGVHYVKDEFDKAKLDRQAMFAKDGFHPSKLTYQVWADTLVGCVAKLYSNEC